MSDPLHYPQVRSRYTRRFMVRDIVLSPWGDRGTVTKVERTQLWVKWDRSGGDEPEPIDRSLVQLRPVGRPKKP